jgi:hypothetical protein
LVATLAVAAIEHGRRLLWVPSGPLAAGGLQSVCHLAAARFWQLLSDGVDDLNVRPPRWRGLAAANAFIAVDSAGRFYARLPAAAAAAPAAAPAGVFLF